MYFTRLQQEHTAAKNMKRHLLKSGKKRDPVATGIHNWEFNLEIFWGKSRPETMPAIYGFKSLNHVKLAYCRSNHFNLCSKILCLQLSYLLAASKIQSYFSNGVLNSLVLYLQLCLGWTIRLYMKRDHNFFLTGFGAIQCQDKRRLVGGSKSAHFCLRLGLRLSTSR